MPFEPDPVLLARVQFAFTIGTHILFPTFTIGLAAYLVVLEGLWLATGRTVWYGLYRFWLPVFAVSFAMGVVSGVVMSYEFGTNWSRFAERTGAVIGPLLSYEVMTAFFLEATFLGIMLFGERRVGRRFHFAATCLVALGTLVSAFWVLAANSWMHTPAGYAIRDGMFVPEDWVRVVFNPSFPYRFVHMVVAAFLSTAFVVGAAAAWQVYRGRDGAAVRRMLAMALGMAVVTAPLQAVVGDLHGLNTLEHQPAKIAAIEGHWETRAGQPLILFGLPDDAAEETAHALEIPRLGSLILTHDPDGVVRGLAEWPRGNRPPSEVVFWSFRLMVGLGLLMIVTAVAGVALLPGGRLYRLRPFQAVLVAMGPSGFIAVLAGWVTTEVGRQPWIVHGLLRTGDSVSPVLGQHVAISLSVLVAVYALVLITGIGALVRLMGRPLPEEKETE